MRKTVAILGGGVAGLSAAHELAERGFKVHVYERKPVLGGKARSIPVPNSGAEADAAPPRRTRLPLLPGILQACHRHHAPHAVRRPRQRLRQSQRRHAHAAGARRADRNYLDCPLPRQPRRLPRLPAWNCSPRSASRSTN